MTQTFRYIVRIIRIVNLVLSLLVSKRYSWSVNEKFTKNLHYELVWNQYFSAIKAKSLFMVLYFFYRTASKFKYLDATVLLQFLIRLVIFVNLDFHWNYVWRYAPAPITSQKLLTSHTVVYTYSTYDTYLMMLLWNFVLIISACGVISQTHENANRSSPPLREQRLDDNNSGTMSILLSVM